MVSQVTSLLTQMSQAIAAAASIAILAGIAVLIGAIAASRERRVYDSVILKLLGATRGQILGRRGWNMRCSPQSSRCSRSASGWSRRIMWWSNCSTSASPPIRWSSVRRWSAVRASPS